MAKGRQRRGTPPEPARGLAAVLLAAGASSRLGECKALVDLDGETPLERLTTGIRALAQPDSKILAPATLVVTGPHTEEISNRLPGGCELLPNPDAASGRTGGLALAATRRVGFDLVVVPVDVPRVPPGVFQALSEAWHGQGAPAMGWLAPRFQGRFGHPILIGRALASRLARFPADKPLSDLRALADPLLSFECDSPEVLEDLDTPSDLANLRALLGKNANQGKRESE